MGAARAARGPRRAGSGRQRWAGAAGRAGRPARLPALSVELLGRHRDDRRLGGGVPRRGLRVGGHHRPFQVGRVRGRARDRGRGPPARRDRRRERPGRGAPRAQGGRGRYPGGRRTRLRTRRARPVRLRDRLDPHALRDVRSRDDAARAHRHGRSPSRDPRPSHGPAPVAARAVRDRSGAGARESRRARVRKGIARLEKAYPDATCALQHNSALELLVATILSAQSTDARVNMVTPALFAKYRAARDYAGTDPQVLEQEIHSTGFFRNKTKSIIGMAQALVERHGGAVPDTMEQLVQLPGVGRKTANVVLGTWFGKNEGLVVDTHVQRLATLLGLPKG